MSADFEDDRVTESCEKNQSKKIEKLTIPVRLPLNDEEELE
jgi:hypothetical protein